MVLELLTFTYKTIEMESGLHGTVYFFTGRMMQKRLEAGGSKLEARRGKLKAQSSKREVRSWKSEAESPKPLVDDIKE